MGCSRRAGLVIVRDGAVEADARTAHVPWNEPGIGVMRHAGPGHAGAIAGAKQRGLKPPTS